jgi:hypothetical protein
MSKLGNGNGALLLALYSINMRFKSFSVNSIFKRLASSVTSLSGNTFLISLLTISNKLIKPPSNKKMKK